MAGSNIDYEQIFKNIPIAVRAVSKDKVVVAANKEMAALTGVPIEKAVGMPCYEQFGGELCETACPLEQGMAGEKVVLEAEKQRTDGSPVLVRLYAGPLVSDDGEKMGIVESYVDITREHEDEERIMAFQRELLEVSTPVITVWDGVVSVPIMGTLDSERTQLVMENLLEAIVAREAEVAIIDISGIGTVDSAVADHLIRTAKAVRLVGAVPILTGINANIAQTIARLGIELEGLKTMSTLRDGLRYAISLQSGEK